MHCSKKTVRDIDVSSKKVFLRCDFNVPRDKDTGVITDKGRVVAALPTINYLLDHNAAIILCSHLGRPKGSWKPELSLAPVAELLSKELGKPVKMSKDVIGEDAMRLSGELKPGEVMLLENVRFHKEEEANDPDFAKKLADMADIYVTDAFGCVHRAHASTSGIAAYLPAVSGLLMELELKYLGEILTNPKRPFTAILGGSKVSDKLGVISNLLEKADTLLLGGGMAFTFIKAAGGHIGKSLCENEQIDYAKDMMEKAKRLGVNLLLPVDTVAAKEFAPDAESVTVDIESIPDDCMGLDIGPRTAEIFSNAILGSATVVWNGPMGVFEYDAFAGGTKAVAKAIADSGAESIIGGGDSASAVRKFGYSDRITHISTGGGASLEFLEGKNLPGISCLMDMD
jgi:phosphoglycerate kinase